MKMKKSFLGLLGMAALMASASVMAANYELDPMHTNARFTVDHFATSSNVGGFFNLNGRVQYDAVAKTGLVDVTIPLSSLDTGRDMFTQHLKSDEFFNAAVYPTMRFASDKWLFDRDGKVKMVVGKLTMLGKTLPVNLQATKFNCYQNAMLKAQVCGGDFEGVIDRTQWGMDKYVDVIPTSRYVKLNIQVEAVKK